MNPLLTIIIPTYNRAACLRMLLEALRVELRGLDGHVAVIIGDNASTDDTPAVAQNFASIWPETRLLRHKENLGPDENFCRCVEQVSSSYFWIIGDDDLPRAGAIQPLLIMLREHQPDLVYLSSMWTTVLACHDESLHVNDLEASLLDRVTFARRVHVWTTFISGSIVKRALAPDYSLRRFTGSHLVQLGWVLGALRNGSRFVHVATPCVLATSGNSGGYSLLKVFGNNFQRIAREAMSGSHELESVAEGMIRRASLAYLPDLVWAFRQNRVGSFDPSENVTAALKPELGSSLAYRFLIQPLSIASPSIAIRLVQLARVMACVVAKFDSLRARAAGVVRPV